MRQGMKPKIGAWSVDAASCKGKAVGDAVAGFCNREREHVLI